MRPRASRQPAGATGIPDDRAAVEHALNRLTFGPRPGRGRGSSAMGLTRWIDAAAESVVHRRSAPPSGRLPAAPTRGRANLSNTHGSAARSSSAVSRCRPGRQKLTRAVYSERQLEEVLVDFWFNHFNVFAGKGRTARASSPITSARRSGRMSGAASASCLAPRPRAPRCSSIWITG